MKLKFTFFLFFSLISSLFYSQIAITEVYYDTPYNEKLTMTLSGEAARKHHRGEFIELYNFSDKDVNLKNWYIKDLIGTYWLPDKLLIKGEFIVIAYSTLRNTTTFPEHFTTTQGKENQILYQDKILLRNKREIIKAGYSFDGKTMLDKSTVEWYNPNPSSNFVKDVWTQPSAFYNVKSMQLNSNNSYIEATPNPLDAIYKPPTQNYEDLVRDDFIQNYSYLDWTDNVNALVNKLCQISIQKIEQLPNGIYNSGGKCFSYDIAGNYISSSDCNPSNNGPQTNEYNYDELEAIKNSIVVYPNPATSNNSYVVNISWSGPSINKITNLQVYTSGGGLVYGFAPTSGINSTSFSLQGQLPGAFVANFILNTGQVISKNILKW